MYTINILWFSLSDFPRIIVRPILHAPEIDPYDEISFAQIVWVCSSSSEIYIGDKVVYIL